MNVLRKKLKKKEMCLHVHGNLFSSLTSWSHVEWPIISFQMEISIWFHLPNKHLEGSHYMLLSRLVGMPLKSNSGLI